MLRTPFHHVVLTAIAFCCGVAGTGSAFAAGQVFNVTKFENVKERWAGLEVTVEGRWSFYGDETIQLRNCSVPFRSETKLQPLGRREANLEITGMLQKAGNGKFEVIIRRVREMPNDLEHFEELQRASKRTSADDWYQLADWALERGNLYRDSQLLDKSKECRKRGFEEERRKLPYKDAAAVARLAERSEKLGLPLETQEDLWHESFLIRRESLQQTPEPQAMKQWLDDLAKQLPGCKDPLMPDNPNLRQTYFTDTYKTYAATKVEERPQLHRLLWSEMQLKLWQQEQKPDFSNSEELAERIDKQLPEYHAVAEKMRDDRLAVRVAAVPEMKKAELLQLKQDLLARNKKTTSDRAIAEWLRVQQLKLQPEDVAGQIRQAELYTELLNDEDTTRRQLLAVAEKYPEFEDLQKKLPKLGYVFVNNKWIQEADFQKRPERRIDEALQQGRIEIGMTATQVRKAMGPPTSLTRVSSGGQVNEIWTYQIPGAEQPLKFFLTRRWTQPEGSVIGVDKLP